MYLKMKKVIFTNVIVVLLSLTAMAQNKKVAVFDPAGSIPTATRDMVREEISSVIVNTPGYKVLERAQINKVLEENKFQMGGLVDDSQISDIGKRLGADFALVSTVQIMDDGRYHFSCKLINVLTAEVEKQKTGRSQAKNDLLDIVSNVVAEMFGQLSNKSVVNNAPAQEPSTPKQNKSGNSNNPPVKNTNTNTVSACGLEIQGSDLYTEKTTWNSDICPAGWRLPTRQELNCMCREQNKIGNFKSNAFSNYFTGEFDNKGKIYIRSFDDCKESTENVKTEKAWIRCVR